MGFEDDLRAFEKKATSRIRLFRRALVLKIAARVILRTPVDTGRARANWQYSVGSPADGVVESEDKEGAGTLAGIRLATEAIDHRDSSAFLTNNLPYIEALENGHSQRQAPNGMVAITIAEFDGLAEQVRRQVEGDSDANPES